MPNTQFQKPRRCLRYHRFTEAAPSREHGEHIHNSKDPLKDQIYGDQRGMDGYKQQKEPMQQPRQP